MFIGQIDQQQNINFSKTKYPGVKRLPSGKLEKSGEVFEGFNKPKTDTKTDHKKVVLAKEGDKVKIVRYGKDGYSDFRKHKNPKRRERFQKRHRAIKLKDGTPAHKSKLQAAYWSTKKQGGTW